jgi:nitrogen fixation/metabolism regulation signal transduction histidine kinase
MMDKFTKLLRRISNSVIPVVVMTLFMLTSLWLLSAATENSSQFGRMHVVLVIINILGLIVLVGLIGVNVVRLVRQYQRSAIGSKLTAKLVVIFVIMALIPVSIVFYFSLGFLQKGIDSWFDVRVERAMDDALELGRSSLDMRMRGLLKQTRNMASNISEVPNDMVLFNLNELRDQSAASELTLMTQSGRIIASSSANPTIIIPHRPGDAVLSEVRQNNSYVGLAPVGELGLHVRVAVSVDRPEASIDPVLLFVLYPVENRISLLTSNVQSAYAKYKELVFLRGPLKQSFSFTLVLVVLVTLLSAVWAAFFFAQRLVAPIRILAIGTRAVASGNYHKKLPITQNDELGALVESFVDMTNKISTAQDEAKKSQHQAQRERAYLGAVLGRLSSGVITLDKTQTVRALNATASQILEVNAETTKGHHLSQLQTENSETKTFVQTLISHIDDKTDDWREEVTLLSTTGHRTLMCQGSRLPAIKGMSEGFVVVFDDITTLIEAQRSAAWGEVAQRLAHEIKNPLTPIQLSAERLRHKYLETMSPEDAEVLDRSTHTIVQQVQALKEMVQAFSEYARTPKLHLQPLSIETIANEVLDLYRGDEQKTEIDFHASHNIPNVEADPGRIRQLLHNLIRNAIESLTQHKNGKIELSLSSIELQSKRYVELRVQDNGVGIPDNMMEKLFEPYATSKPKGSGLGLAVVKRIIEEHSGILFAENVGHGGACIVIRIPVLESASDKRKVVKLRQLGNS